MSDIEGFGKPLPALARGFAEKQLPQASHTGGK
jgi:hypothetical protein